MAMKTFGQLKTYIENSLTESYGTNEFKTNMKFFKDNVLSDKQICEAYSIYDNLSESQELDQTVSGEYLEESLTILENILISNKDKIGKLSEGLKLDVNNYIDIDNLVYHKTSDKILERIESKNKIKSLLQESKVDIPTSKIDLPLSSMKVIAAKTFDRNFSNLSESDLNQVKKYLSMSNDELKVEYENEKTKIFESLNLQLNESSSDQELKTKVDKTIEKINSNEVNLFSLFQLKQLSENL
jgi:septum formation topological specificity factor MinE